MRSRSGAQRSDTLAMFFIFRPSTDQKIERSKDRISDLNSIGSSWNQWLWAPVVWFPYGHHYIPCWNNIIDIRNNSKKIQREKIFIQIKFIQPVPYRVKFKVYSTYRVKNNGYMMSNKIWCGDIFISYIVLDCQINILTEWYMWKGRERIHHLRTNGARKYGSNQTNDLTVCVSRYFAPVQILNLRVYMCDYLCYYYYDLF